MKTYRGDIGPPPIIRVDEYGDERVLLVSDDLAWGKKAPDPGRRLIAILLLNDALNGDTARAHKYHQRFKHRTVAMWNEDQPWEITDQEIIAHVKDMEAIELETAPMRRQVDREPAPVVMEGGQGIGWTKQGENR